MDATLQTTDGRAVIDGFLAAGERGDEQAIVQLVDPEVVMEWPQSGERFSGRERALAAMAATEVKPEPAGEPRIVGSGDVWTLMMPVRYGPDVYHYVGVFEIGDGRIRRATEYFGAPFPASEARRAYADPPDA